MLNSIVLPPPPPLPGATPWRDAVTARNHAQLQVFDGYSALDISNKLPVACTPFDNAGAGLWLSQLKEVGFFAMWAYEFLVDRTS